MKLRRERIMKKKVLAMLLTGAMAFSMLTGCGKGSGGGGSCGELL